MSMIPEVQCRRCGEMFSSMRSACPHCGTRRVVQSGRTPGTSAGTVKGTASYERAETNTKWQMIFGLILVVAVILAVIVMVSTSLSNTDIGQQTKATPPVVTNAMPTMELPPTPPPTPTPNVEKIEIKFYETTIESDFTMHVGDEALTLTALVYPLTIQGAQVEWSVDHEDVLKVTPTDDGSGVKVECIGTINGGVKLTAKCLGKETSIRVYCIE